jgi:hypothetical protein
MLKSRSKKATPNFADQSESEEGADLDDAAAKAGA